MIILRSYAYLIFLLVPAFAAGCQDTVYLMPTPSFIASGAHNLFALNPHLKKNNKISVFYATNRSPLGKGQFTNYSIFPGRKISLGVAHLEIGDEKTDWEKLFNISTTDSMSRRPALYLDRLEELVSLPLPEGITALPEKFQDFVDQINTCLDNSMDKDILVYVHGANSTIYRASAHAAQYRHFTGQNSVVLVFLWPSAENILAYGKDVRHARRSAPAFKHLISILFKHTKAEHINILAYSAGAKIVSPGLAGLGRDIREKKSEQVKLGEVYFASADIGIDTFVENLQSYIDIPRRVTMSVNMKDSVLKMAWRRHKTSRAGRPDTGDLGEKDAEWIYRAVHDSYLHVISVDDKTVKGMSPRSHNFWYSHPWVSSDMLVQFMFHMDPLARGLTKKVNGDGLYFWTFPENYPDRIVEILDRAKQIQN